MGVGGCPRTIAQFLVPEITSVFGLNSHISIRTVFNVLFDGAERRAPLAAGPGSVGGVAGRGRGVAGVVMATTRNRSEVWEGRLGVRRGSNGSHGEGKGKALYKGPYSGLVGTLEWTTEKKNSTEIKKEKKLPQIPEEKKKRKVSPVTRNRY